MTIATSAGLRAHRGVLIVAVLVAALLALPACSGGDSSSGDTTPTTIRSGDAITTKHLCAATSPARGVDWGRMAPEDLKALALPINVNEASAEELASLPRIGPVLADRLIAARPFASVADLLRVRGIGPKTLAKLQRRARTSW